MNTQTAIFAGGCFWCTEAVFKMLRGVLSVESGYTGGKTENPSYEQVSAGKTGHAEAARITFDPAVISYRDLLTVFFSMHDPTTLNRQGADVGTQYRSAIFYTDDSQRSQAQSFIGSLSASYGEKAVVTEVVPFEIFYPAEHYHKNYFENNKEAPYCRIVIDPKIEKLKKEFPALLKKQDEMQ